MTGECERCRWWSEQGLSPRCPPHDGEWADAIMARQDLIYRNAPDCPACRADQVQAISYVVAPAIWRCRICKHRFEFEPQSN